MPPTARSRPWRRTIRVESADDPALHRYPNFAAATLAAFDLAEMTAFREVFRRAGLHWPEPDEDRTTSPLPHLGRRKAHRRARASTKEAV